MTTTKAVILDSNNEILALLPEDIGKDVNVAGAVALDGSPVNRKFYKVSASKAGQFKFKIS